MLCWFCLTVLSFFFCFFFFFNDTATTEIYTLSLHDALPISSCSISARKPRSCMCGSRMTSPTRSEEHTSELQSRSDLVCRLLLEKKKKKNYNLNIYKKKKKKTKKKNNKIKKK